jgi:hypothetical protein
MLKLLRFAKLFKVPQILRDISKSKKNSNVGSSKSLLAKSFLVFLMISHFISCIWIFLAKLTLENWISRSYPPIESSFDKYLALCTSFGLNVTTGYGDIVPVSKFERIFTIFLL